jgi:hypothetical protein
MVAGSRYLSWHSLSIGDAREDSSGVPSSPYGKTLRIRLEPIGYVPPVGFEAAFYRQQETLVSAPAFD